MGQSEVKTAHAHTLKIPVGSQNAEQSGVTCYRDKNQFPPDLLSGNQNWYSKHWLVITKTHNKWVFCLCIQQGSCSEGTGHPVAHLDLKKDKNLPYGFTPAVCLTVTLVAQCSWWGRRVCPQNCEIFWWQRWSLISFYNPVSSPVVLTQGQFCASNPRDHLGISENSLVATNWGRGCLLLGI